MKIIHSHWHFSLTTAFLILLAVCPKQVKSQQDPVYTQYLNNLLSIQPAYAGISGVLSISALSRAQWVGWEGAPNSNTFTIHFPMKSFNVGLGLSIVNDKWGPILQNGVYVDYAYRLVLRPRQFLALGIKAGFNTYHARFRDLELNDQIDPSFAQNVDFKMLPNVGFGALWHSDIFFLGFSIPKLFKNNIVDDSDKKVYREVLHMYAMGGYVFPLSDKVKIKPTFLFRWSEQTPSYTDMAANILLYERVWFGITYRLKNSYALSFQFIVNPQLRFGYSFDLTTFHENMVNSGTHEFTINYEFQNSRRNRRYAARYF
ncbi:MAG: type IX secretion system membrane protein PorP/SprF [Bacteroidetes bacterium]|nr:type IX secretion system membrane protein PorP/SprF [Bacteroidota bacterium]MCL6101195.1 type IX secretion system membrane protein PorP/SprF [Bacteroidota bacterium]